MQVRNVRTAGYQNPPAAGERGHFPTVTPVVDQPDQQTGNRRLNGGRDLSKIRKFDHPPSADELAGIAERSLELIPENLRPCIHGIAILVEEFADDDVLEEMNIGDPFELLGLYQGISLDTASVLDVHDDVNRIYLYRRPLLDAWAGGTDTLEDLVCNTIIHEIGHHFGLSDDDMERLESG